MKKLKIILLFSITIYVYIITSNLIYKNSIDENNNTFTGIVKNITIKEDKITITINELLINYYTKDKLDIKLGDEIKVIGLIKLPNENNMFNLFNYRNYLLSNKIYYILEAESVTKIKDNQNIFYTIKNNIIKRIDNMKSSSYLKTFILGDKNELNEETKKTYQENGVSHLLAISGMHITLLSSILLYIFKNNKYSHIIISIFLIFYLFLTSFSPSVIRAVSLFIFSKVGIKKIDLLLLIGELMLIYNPYYIYNIGFVFSFIISLFLILFGKKNKNYIISLFNTSLICFLASIPILINNYFYINITSVLLNIVFVPIVSFIVFPLSLLTLIMPLFDNLLMICINILEYLSSLFNHLNINIILCHVPFYIIILYYIVITFSLKKNKYFILIIMLLIHSNINLFKTNNYLTMLDVGQGDSILLEIKNKSILIDTGGVSYDYSIVKNKTIPYLYSLGIKKLELLVITHGDFDHIGEAINLIDNFKVEKVLLNSGKNNELENKLINVLKNKNINYELISEKKINIDKVTLNFINKVNDNENEDSLITYTNISNRNILLMGDAGKVSENYILNTYNLPKMDILKVGHHGSKNSSSTEFISKLLPNISLISVGLKNRFNHPNEDTLNILNSYSATTYLTSLNGSIRINLNSFKIQTCY